MDTLNELTNHKPTLPPVNIIEVDGVIYEVDKYYIFSNKDGYKADFISKLLGYSKFHGKFHGSSGYWECCTPVDTSILGTITIAPKKFIDGAAYQFDCQMDKNMVGVLCSGMRYGSLHRMLHTPLGEYNLEYCTNIVRLVPEEG